MTFAARGGKNAPMEPETTRTIFDYWPLFALGVLALFAIVGVTRGLKRPADSSKNNPGGGGSNFMGRGGRW